MNGYLLDTNACIGWLKGHSGLIERIAATPPAQVFICAPVRYELWFGACKSARIPENQQKICDFFALVPSLPFDDTAAERCGETRADLVRRGTPIGPYNLQIAAIALRHSLTVVTNNTDEFRRVMGLVVEDWQSV